MSASKLPPGGSWIPFLGDSLSLTKNPIGYLTSKRIEHGPIFRAKLLGYDVAIIAGLPEFLEVMHHEHDQQEGSYRKKRASKTAKSSPPLSCEHSLMNLVRDMYGPGPLLCDGRQSIKLREAMLGCIPNELTYSGLLASSLKQSLATTIGESMAFYQFIK